MSSLVTLPTYYLSKVRHTTTCGHDKVKEFKFLTSTASIIESGREVVVSSFLNSPCTIFAKFSSSFSHFPVADGMGKNLETAKNV